MMFTYESPFKVFYVSNPKNDAVWCSQEDSVPAADQMKFSPSVVVWGGMTARRLTTLHLVPRGVRLDSQYYINKPGMTYLRHPILLSLLCCFAIAELALVGSGQDLLKRDSIVQGWALVEDDCPQGTGVCGARSCCPLGSWCDTTSSEWSNMCCPTSG